MSVFHDEVEIEDFEYDEETETYSYPCPCGDRFLITREDLENGEDVATCPSCSLILRVIYDQVGGGGLSDAVAACFPPRRVGQVEFRFAIP
ncbi:PREDICTED: DPH3 homolog isoform X1 [Haliaeetus leucocephalus]|uniref:DPH3 homolog isoform X1 n=1 Tax=Haliaeetus leucocephalus TaxID=52644 RepID=UPI00053CC3EA|nr:PREDICTED: DPH3 homolog isoform X1 [Haliaeetus leucocephalus]XP_010584190.1 PREDICTED: DPH3 homolog isoform X1 [Haliaeetus leucocephalus]